MKYLNATLDEISTLKTFEVDATYHIYYIGKMWWMHSARKESYFQQYQTNNRNFLTFLPLVLAKFLSKMRFKRWPFQWSCLAFSIFPAIADYALENHHLPLAGQRWVLRRKTTCFVSHQCISQSAVSRPLSAEERTVLTTRWASLRMLSLFA